MVLLVSACVPITTGTEISPTPPTNPSPAAPSPTPPEYWTPTFSDSFQIQLSDYPPDLLNEATIFELDLFETPQETISDLHNAGKKVICYLNAGAWEEFRPDANDFPPAVLGKDYIGWEGERWLDVSQYETFIPMMSARFDLAILKGCDGIDADNINGYQHDTGFAITARDQLIYNIWLTEQAHIRGLAIGMKNDNEQITDLVGHFDFAIVEDCSVYDECGDFRLFSQHNKVVFQIEYTDEIESLDHFCEESLSNNYTWILKNRNLDAWVQSCHSR